MCHTMYIPYVITHTGLLNIKESNIKNPVNSVIFANGKIILVANLKRGKYALFAKIICYSIKKHVKIAKTIFPLFYNTIDPFHIVITLRNPSSIEKSIT